MIYLDSFEQNKMNSQGFRDLYLKELKILRNEFSRKN